MQLEFVEVSPGTFSYHSMQMCLPRVWSDCQETVDRGGKVTYKSTINGIVL